MKSLKGLSGQHMQPSQDVRPQAASPTPPGSPPTSPAPLPSLQTPALVVKGLLPARGGRLLLLFGNCHGHLKGLSQSTGTATPLNGSRGSLEKYKTRSSSSSRMLHALSVQKKITNVFNWNLTNRVEVSSKCFILIEGGPFYWHICCAYRPISSLSRS